MFGLTSALWGEITIEGGRVQQQNFDTYRLLRLNDVPELDIALAATGQRIRSLPFPKHGLA